MKLRLLAVALAAITLAGTAAAQDTTSEKGKLSYAIGYNTGSELSDLSSRGEAIDINTVVKALQDAYAKKPPTVAVDQLRTAVESMQKRQMAKAKAAFDKASGENKSKSDAFLAQNKAKSGVKTLPSGVQYRIVENGTGAKPSANSDVQIQYKGNIANGPTFVDTTVAQQGQPAGPVTLKMSQIPLVGLREALALMPTGSRWEVVLPADKAYGNTPQSPIGPNQAVVFDVKLVSVK